MTDAILKVPPPVNEPVLSYAPGSPERSALKAQLERLLQDELEIPLFVDGKEVTTGKLGYAVCPHDHRHRLARFHQASAEHVQHAAIAAARAHGEWAATPWEARLAIFLRAAELLATKYRPILNAATMLGQSKTAHQAEIDASCELVDFFRFNAFFATQLMAEQPLSSAGVWNYLDHRPLEGFVFAVTPFNFTSIAGNLPTAPALMGNTVLWKPASTAVYSGHFIMKLLVEAGLPPGVINFLPGSGGQVGQPALTHPDLAGVHFTGSTQVFQGMWRTIGEQIASYKSYPRVVGETGGKDFIFVHPSADFEAVVANCLRGAFEYQGQKCSAASRLYVPKSMFPRLRDRLADEIRALPMGNPLDFRNFMAAVIDRGAFEEIRGFIEHARGASDARIVVGGECDETQGYFIRPTLVHADQPDFRLMREEIFGPVLTCYAYPDERYAETLEVCNHTSPYALTGAIFANDRRAVSQAAKTLRFAAGNFYVNDKPTGAVVGQQPFGGGRASGTNDKAGSILNLMRWVSPRAVKETFVPATDYRYPFMREA
ncbi:MAG: L-glutamate gamma-semialdehyde dehydrogenase [Deltaproteobacteria bacterium]|nr:L-glutamate gamma-semialdehyde dehydrogenase [Deltaproteobacteria bacterium]